MPDCVAGSVEEVEAAVSVEVERFELADFQSFALAIEIDFSKSTAFPCLFVDRRFRDSRPAWDECFFEAWTYDEVGGTRESSWVSSVVLQSFSDYSHPSENG